MSPRFHSIIRFPLGNYKDTISILCLDSHSNKRSNFVFAILILTWKICSRSFAIIRHMWSSTFGTGLSATSLSCTPIQASVIFPATRVPFLVIYRAFSFTWPASKPIYWNKRKHLHKNRVQLTVDLFGTQPWLPFHCFGTPIWPRWRHVKTLYWLFWRCIWDWVCVVSKSTVGMFWNEFPFPASWQPIKEAVASVQTSTSFRPSFYRNLKMANYPSNIFYGEDLSTKETLRRMLTRTSTFGTLQNYYLLSFTEEIMRLCWFLPCAIDYLHFILPKKNSRKQKTVLLFWAFICSIFFLLQMYQHLIFHSYLSLFRGPSSRSGFSKITREISTTAESKHVPIT